MGANAASNLSDGPALGSLLGRLWATLDLVLPIAVGAGVFTACPVLAALMLRDLGPIRTTDQPALAGRGSLPDLQLAHLVPVLAAVSYTHLTLPTKA